MWLGNVFVSIQPRLGRQIAEGIAISDLQLLTLVGRKQSTGGSHLYEIFFRLECHVEFSRGLGHVRQLAFVFADVGPRTMLVVGFAQGEIENLVPHGDPTGGRFFIALIGWMAQVEIDAF